MKRLTISEDQKYDILRKLDRKGIDIQGHTIDISDSYKKNKIGNKTWGLLDCLVKTGEYTIFGFFEEKVYRPIF